MIRSTCTPGLMLALLLASACNSLDGDPPTPATAPVDAGPDPVDGGTGTVDAGEGPDGLTVRVEPSFDTTPGTGFTSCEEHFDCVLADAGCNGCCQQSAVHRSLVSDYEQALADACDAAGPPGAICDCAFGDLVPRCEAGRCVAVERGQLDACFSPANPEPDDGGDPAGCACALEGQQICVGAALVCERVPRAATLAWIAVEDGPCWPRPDNCPDGTVVESAEACLAASSDCYERDDGSFCAVRAADE
ncbi:MAG: hypothetical protein OXT09_12490 [Myxococcales bacterium]|nr:hypothetical protein [Myxococcales bacterium]